MNTEKLKKGLLKMGIFILLCFISPVIIYQAFKNQDHQFFLYSLGDWNWLMYHCNLLRVLGYKNIN